jgi:hypothetical protein
MTQAALKPDSASRDSVSLKYLRGQVARQMAGVYAAFASTSVEVKKSESSKSGRAHTASNVKR